MDALEPRRVKRIAVRFAVMLAGAAILPLLTYGAVSVVSLRTGAQQAVIVGNQNVARRAAEQIELYITGSVKILKAVAADLQQTGLETWQQDRILKNFVLQFPEFRELTLIDDLGSPTVSSSLGGATVGVPGSEGLNIEGALMSRFSVDDDLLPTAIVAVRLSGAGAGWLVGRVSLEELWRMVDRIQVGERGRALVVARDGLLLAHGDQDAKSRVARGDNLRDHPIVQALQRG
ncbi:MAG: cache domain-containing protein, partial [Vicinamibacterales bacterium]